MKSKSEKYLSKIIVTKENIMKKILKQIWEFIKRLLRSTKIDNELFAAIVKEVAKNVKRMGYVANDESISLINGFIMNLKDTKINKLKIFNELRNYLLTKVTKSKVFNEKTINQKIAMISKYIISFYDKHL